MFATNFMPSKPLFGPKLGQNNPFSGHKSTKTPLGIIRVVIVVVIYQYTLHEAKATFHNSITPIPYFWAQNGSKCPFLAEKSMILKK